MELEFLKSQTAWSMRSGLDIGAVPRTVQAWSLQIWRSYETEE